MLKFSAVALSLVLTVHVFSDTPAGTNSKSLDDALKTENANANGLVFFAQDVTLIDPNNSNEPTQVRAVNSDGTFTFVGNNITISGFGHTLNGDSKNVRGFFVGGRNGTSTGSVTINDLIFSGCKVQGGNSGISGGGMGAGGGLFVYKNTRAILKNCTFSNCSATGGSSDATLGGGGGGMKGTSTPGSNGGGGFGGNGTTTAGGGCSDFPVGNASGGNPGKNFDGGGIAGSSGVGGDLSGVSIDGGFGGGAGGGAGASGIGGFGGGGSSSGANAGNGGFGGGGGASGGMSASGGDGGFGAGGGAADFDGSGGFGGGDGDSAGGIGGAGAGFGGAIFVMDGAELTIEESISFNNNNVAAGTGLNPNAAGNGALGKDIFMMSGSTVIFDISSDVALLNPIEGNQGDETPGPPVPTTTGGLTKRGSALLSLTGDNTFTGKALVEEGELRINSSVVSNIEVNGGALSGNFSVKKDATGNNGGDITLNSGGIAPGVNGVGTIMMEGIYTQNGGTLAVDITPTGGVNDLIMGATHAFLGTSSTLQVIINPGNYIAGTQYTIIDAPVTGVFTNVIETGGLGALIDIQVDYSSVVLTILTTRLFEDQVIDSGPPSDVVKCIRQDDITPNSDFAIAVESLGTLSNKEVNKALTSLSAVNFGALEWANARNNSYAADILSQHLFDLCCSPRDCCSCDCNTSGWISVFGNFMNNQEGLDFLGKYSADATGVLVGMDSCCSPCFFYGGAFGYTRTNFIWRGNLGEGDTDSYYGALYGNWDTDSWFLTEFSILGGATFNDMDRHIEYASIRRDAKSDFWSYFFTAHLGFKSDWHWCCSTFERFALVDYHYYGHEEFKEDGADSLNLVVESKNQHMMRGEVGVKWYYERECDCSCYSPYIGLSWVGEFPLNDSKQPASFTGQTCVIDATSYDSSVQLAAPQGGVKWTHCNGASFLLGYKGLFNGSVRVNEVEARFEWIF